ncbi:2-hydroxyacid dehydrogenase [Candidatus Nitrosocosmicus hydrocola]|uniref:2-hydroxyacid dehydrogenase n=1 Tax=Candidatus Nitrosocosmicus hydrocola TaxID=1826872 RepID=UPI000AA7FEDA|nr:D-glycerate dehydrogenase [Candidatus Nitrosocosmicus hydrocola]
MVKSKSANLKVLITRPISDVGLSILKRENYELINNTKEYPLKPIELKRLVKGVDAILCFLNDTIDKETMDIAGPNLKIISTFSTGFEHIDIKEAKKRNIKVGYTGNILTETTADLAFGLMLSIGRRIVEGDKMVRDGKWNYGWGPDLMIGTDIHGKTLGIIGMGKIGTAIAKRAQGFGMKILYTNRATNTKSKIKSFPFDYTNIKLTDLKDIAKESDYIIISCSLNEESYHLINSNFISQMKKSAFLINIARGKILNQKDLILALRKKSIAGAALDVYEDEPIKKDSILKRMKNTVLLPHIGSASRDTRDKMSEIAALNIVNVLQGHEDKALLIE